MLKPKVIFLDAVGTLFGVTESVGHAYAEVAQRFDVQADPAALNKAFFRHFKAAEPMAFPDVEPTHVPACEYAWWRAIAVGTFQTVGLYEQFEDFDAFFADLYHHFAGADPWFVYPDVYHSLERWRGMNIPLGIISNFDSRLYTVLEALALNDFFDSVTLCTEVGAAKPNAQIFATALDKHGCTAAEAWHVGDSYGDDYEGAIAAGLRGIWLRRPQDLSR